ncbi:RDD family protein [Mycobacterium parmense]
MRISAALHRERARRHPLPEPLPGEPPVPFEYLIRLYTIISNPEYLSPRDQAALVAQLQVGLREDGQHEAARNDIMTMLRKLRDREDVTYRTRTEVEAIVAAIDTESLKQPPPITTDTATPVESAIIDDAAKASSDTMAPPERLAPASGSTIIDGPAGATGTPESAVPTEVANSTGTPLHGSDQSFVDIGGQDARQKPTAEPKPPPSRQKLTILPPTSPGRRVEATLIDAFPILIVYGIAGAIAEYLIGKFCEPYVGGFKTVCGGHVTATGLAAIVIGLLVALAYSVWNWGYRQGTTGATIGKSVMKFKVLSEVTGEPVGSDAERTIKVAVLALLVLLPLSGLVIEAAAHIAGPNYHNPVHPY